MKTTCSVSAHKAGLAKLAADSLHSAVSRTESREVPNEVTAAYSATSSASPGTTFPATSCPRTTAAGGATKSIAIRALSWS